MPGQQRRQSGGFDMDGYNDVASRIAEFRAKYPDGCLRPVDPAQPYRLERIGEDLFVVYVAAAYRSPDDRLPGIGIAQEAYPGKTSYTRGSELQNAETSAWGRAIVAALAADTRRGVASHEEVRNRQAERRPMPTREQARTDAVRAIGEATDPTRLAKCARRVAELAEAGVLTAEDSEALHGLVAARAKELEPKEAAGEQG